LSATSRKSRWLLLLLLLPDDAASGVPCPGSEAMAVDDAVANVDAADGTDDAVDVDAVPALRGLCRADAAAPSVVMAAVLLLVAALAADVAAASVEAAAAAAAALDASRASRRRRIVCLRCSTRASRDVRLWTGGAVTDEDDDDDKEDGDDGGWVRFG
jgi:hypothetical protein